MLHGRMRTSLTASVERKLGPGYCASASRSSRPFEIPADHAALRDIASDFPGAYA